MKRLAIIIHFLTVFALCGSLYWNWSKGKEHTNELVTAYTLGKADGIHWARGVIIRKMIEQELIEEQQAKMAKERL
jgi:hypothetical protein